MTVVFQSEALTEYRDAALYSERNFGLGEEFVSAVESALVDISEYPLNFRMVGDEIHIYRMRRFPFYLFTTTERISRRS